jgi:hypothetical protein
MRPSGPPGVAALSRPGAVDNLGAAVLTSPPRWRPAAVGRSHQERENRYVRYSSSSTLVSIVLHRGAAAVQQGRRAGRGLRRPAARPSRLPAAGMTTPAKESISPASPSWSPRWPLHLLWLAPAGGGAINERVRRAR